MIVFLGALFLLLLGYFIYGSFVEKVWGISETLKTPATLLSDGVDYVEMPAYKCFLIQFLNIAGLGPVFGAVLGAIYGPVCLFWIVLGSIFAGGVHDFCSGMLSVRFKGRSIVSVTKIFFGKHFSKLFAVIFVGLLIFVGTVFAVNPAIMISHFGNIPYAYCISGVFLYYFLTTLLSVDKIIGRIYPFFALLLILTTFLLMAILITHTTDFYHGMSFTNLHPKNVPIFPLMFITIACGAISGFHATQSPIVSRCLDNEKNGRIVFYGAMITEGVVALIWATLGICYYNTTGGLLVALENLGQGGVVSDISINLLGPVGGLLAVFAVIVLAITSGDTSFRSARVTLGNCFNFNQAKLSIRLALSASLIFVGVILSRISLTMLWLYFGWLNQTLAAFALWTVSVYLKRKEKNFIITLIPAIFMTVVSATYILNARIGFNLDLTVSKILAIILATIFTVIFVLKKNKKQMKTDKFLI